ncbi:MAG: hypothetical protein ACE5I2_08040 [Anaerolineae bacterium]
MKKILRLRYKDNRGYFSLMWTDYAGGGTGNDTRNYEYLFFPIRDLGTGEIVGFSNDGGYFPEDYPRIMQLLKEHPIRERYDVPELGLVDVTVDQILTAIYEQYVWAPRWEKPPVQLEVLHPA